MNYHFHLRSAHAAFHRAFLLLALGLVAPLVANADVKLHALFSDNMVLQQGMRVPVWGTADNGEKVTVTFAGQTVSTAAKDGKWSVTLPSLRASAEPRILTVNGNNKVEVKNVLVGEVWIASGQSNMEMALRNSMSPRRTSLRQPTPISASSPYRN